MKTGTRAAALLPALCLALSLFPFSALGLGRISSGTVTLTREVYEYNGYANEPEVAVTVDGVNLQRDVDFEVEYSGNVKAGTATVVQKCFCYTRRKKPSYINRKLFAPEPVSRTGRQICL